jgi:hypothetical protein
MAQGRSSEAHEDHVLHLSACTQPLLAQALVMYLIYHTLMNFRYFPVSEYFTEPFSNLVAQTSVKHSYGDAIVDVAFSSCRLLA